MDDAKKQLADKIKTSNNILVTVSRDPSVDQLASCIALTLLLNKQGKHAAAVFSGKVPSTIEFLQPEETLEKNTDSLRDFIISLDKAKADKLRYKVEDNVVRIFITPYKTSISDADLEFTQGDFNVDVVIALGVAKQEDLDEAITAHGRILHDATVTSINTSADGGLGTINWHDPQASSLSELVTDLAQTLDNKLLDSQIATALLTGIISATDRFGNDKTSALTMSASAALLAAGANQQLVATKLDEEQVVSLKDGESTDSQSGDDPSSDKNDGKPEDGALRIDHAESSDDEPDKPEEEEHPEAEQSAPEQSEPAPETPKPDDSAALSQGSKLITEPPTMGGTLTANSQSEELEGSTDPFSLPSAEPEKILDRKDEPITEPAAESTPETPQLEGLTPPPPAWVPPAAPAASNDDAKEPAVPSTNDMSAPIVNDEGRTLTELEKSVNSPHLDPASIDAMRDEVSKALTDSTSATAESDTPEPIEALNAQPLGAELHDTSAPASPTPPPPVDSGATPSADDKPQDSPKVVDPTAPPPVPPPIPFQFGNPPQSQ